MGRQPHYRHTTFDQRRVMFEEWERLDRRYGSVTGACRKAHVSRNVFYDWKERYLEHGVEGLRHPESRAPKHPRELASKLTDEAAAVKEEHETWGLRRVAAEVARRKGIPIPSHNTVKKALEMAGYTFRTGEEGQ
jgi:transposase